MLRKMPGSPSPYDRVARVWREMRKRARIGQADTPERTLGPQPDYLIEADPEADIGIYRVFTPARNRSELVARMNQLTDLMRRKNFHGALVDMRACRMDEAPDTLDLSRDTALPYTMNPLWRLALLVPADDTGAGFAPYESLLKLHLRSGMRMRKFDQYRLAVDWLKKAREGYGVSL